MLELFEKYSVIHFNITGFEVILHTVYPYGEPGQHIISSDLFVFSGDHDHVLEALQVAIADNQLLPNQEQILNKELLLGLEE